MTLLRLFFEFCKIGLFSVGGGLATIPFLADLGERTGWFTSGELANMIAISESTPGPLGVNMATYVGFASAGVAGGIVATLGLVFPCVVVILIVALLMFVLYPLLILLVDSVLEEGTFTFNIFKRYSSL